MPPRRESVLRDSGTPSRDVGHKASAARRNKHHSQHASTIKTERCVQNLERENLGAQVRLQLQETQHEAICEPLKETRQAETQTDADPEDMLADSVDQSQRLTILDRDDSFTDDTELDRLAAALVASREETRRLIAVQLQTGHTLKNMLKYMVMTSGGETEQQEDGDDVAEREGVGSNALDQSGGSVDEQQGGDCFTHPQDGNDLYQQQGHIDVGQQQGRSDIAQQQGGIDIAQQQSESNADQQQDGDVMEQQQDGDVGAYQQSGGVNDFPCSTDAPESLWNA